MQLADPRFRLSLDSERRPVASGRLWAGWIATFLLIIFAVFSRRTDVFLHPQFYAEDGAVFYQQAHELGFWHALLTPYGGYFHLVPRVVASLAQLLPLSAAPLFFNLAAVVIQAAPALLLLTPRLKNAGPLPVRALLALCYVGVPRIAELQGDLAGSHFHFAVLSFVVLIATPPKSRVGRAFDCLILLCSAFTGPFCTILLPVALFIFFRSRHRWTLLAIALLGVGAVVQATSLILLAPRPRGLGATGPLFFRILASQVFLPLFAGALNLYNSLPGPLWFTIVGCVVTLLGASLLLFAFIKGPVELQALVLFATAVLAVSMISPLATAAGNQWEVMYLPGVRARYWYIPYLAVMSAIIWMVTTAKNRTVRVAFSALLLSVLITIMLNWEYEPLPDMNFQVYAREFSGLPVGHRLRIPIYPPGWSFEITRTTPPTSVPPPASTEFPTLKAKFGMSSPAQIKLLLSGSVDTVNGVTSPSLDNPASALHISGNEGVSMRGWLVGGSGSSPFSMDEVYALVSGQLVPCSNASRPDVGAHFGNSSLSAAGFDVHLPFKIFHPGLQPIELIGYRLATKTLYRFPKVLYLQFDRQTTQIPKAARSRGPSLIPRLRDRTHERGAFSLPGLMTIAG